MAGGAPPLGDLGMRALEQQGSPIDLQRPAGAPLQTLAPNFRVGVEGTPEELDWSLFGGNPNVPVSRYKGLLDMNLNE